MVTLPRCPRIRYSLFIFVPLAVAIAHLSFEAFAAGRTAIRTHLTVRMEQIAAFAILRTLYDDAVSVYKGFGQYTGDDTDFPKRLGGYGNILKFILFHWRSLFLLRFVPNPTPLVSNSVSWIMERAFSAVS